MAQTSMAEILRAFVTSSRDRGLSNLKAKALSYLDFMPTVSLIKLRPFDIISASSRIQYDKGVVDLLDNSGLYDWVDGVGKVVPAGGYYFVLSSDGVDVIKFDGTFNLLTTFRGIWSDFSVVEVPSRYLVFSYLKTSAIDLKLLDMSLREVSSFSFSLPPMDEYDAVGIYFLGEDDSSNLNFLVVVAGRTAGSVEVAKANITYNSDSGFSSGSWSFTDILPSGSNLSDFGADDVIDIVSSAADFHVVVYSQNWVASYNVLLGRFDSNIFVQSELEPWEAPGTISKVFAGGGKIAVVLGSHILIYEHDGNKLFDIGASGNDLALGYIGSVSTLFYSPEGLGVITSSKKIHFYDRDILELSHTFDFPLTISFPGKIIRVMPIGYYDGFELKAYVLKKKEEELSVYDIVAISKEQAIYLEPGEYVFRIEAKPISRFIATPKLLIDEVLVLYESS